MIALMLLLTFGEYGSSKDPIVDVVSVIELNHDYDSNGYILNDQLIFWNWKPADNKYEVVDFIILKGGRENLTTEEHKRREKEHQDKWLAEGNPAPPPPYNHPWVGHGAVPYKYGANWVSYFKDDDVYRKSRRETRQHRLSQSAAGLWHRADRLLRNAALLSGLS